MKMLTILMLLSITTFSLAKEGTKKSEYKNYSKATLAGGCFWCMETPFEKVKGVYEVVSGYSGGDEVSPSYKKVASGKTGHREAVTVYFDPKIISYEKILEIFWKQINPTDAGGQFVDRGFQYSTAIYYHDDKQLEIAKKSKEELIKSKRYKLPVITPIEKFKSFYEAENYHQDYYRVSPIRYKYYRWNSGRDQYLEKIWDKK